LGYNIEEKDLDSQALNASIFNNLFLLGQN
jgi:hypothetical protein